jgi:molybdopterin adenylyltransferase
MGHEGHDHRDHSGQHPSHSHAEKEHKAHAPTQVATFVVTCSDSRNEKVDESGKVIREALESQNHPLVGQQLIPDEPERIRAALEEASRAGARAVIFNGGTGIGRRDSTVETLEPFFEKTLPGFGEIFRRLSFDEIGSAAMMSRATAGTYHGMIIFAVPGSPNAVRLAMKALILPELGHAVRELGR